ncbi:MAG: hypothetical protein IJD86_07785 [Clostridia bacterium]|nr:hypothetical protein [Clostridia bacterium]
MSFPANGSSGSVSAEPMLPALPLFPSDNITIGETIAMAITRSSTAIFFNVIFISPHAISPLQTGVPAGHINVQSAGTKAA